MTQCNGKSAAMQDRRILHHVTAVFGLGISTLSNSRCTSTYVPGVNLISYQVHYLCTENKKKSGDVWLMCRYEHFLFPSYAAVDSTKRCCDVVRECTHHWDVSWQLASSWPASKSRHNHANHVRKREKKRWRGIYRAYFLVNFCCLKNNVGEFLFLLARNIRS